MGRWSSGVPGGKGKGLMKKQGKNLKLTEIRIPEYNVTISLTPSEILTLFSFNSSSNLLFLFLSSL